MAKGKARSAKATVAVEKEILETAKSNSEPPAKKIRKSKLVSFTVPTLPKLSGNLLACGQNDVGQLGFNPDDVPEKSRPV